MKTSAMIPLVSLLLVQLPALSQDTAHAAEGAWGKIEFPLVSYTGSGHNHWASFFRWSEARHEDFKLFGFTYGNRLVAANTMFRPYNNLYFEGRHHIGWYGPASFAALLAAWGLSEALGTDREGWLYSSNPVWLTLATSNLELRLFPFFSVSKVRMSPIAAYDFDLFYDGKWKPVLFTQAGARLSVSIWSIRLGNEWRTTQGIAQPIFFVGIAGAVPTER